MYVESNPSRMALVTVTDRTRHTAWALSGDMGSYCFDLDGREDRDAETPDDAYSVDSRTCGESGRFFSVNDSK